LPRIPVPENESTKGANHTAQARIALFILMAVAPAFMIAAGTASFAEGAQVGSRAETLSARVQGLSWNGQRIFWLHLPGLRAIMVFLTIQICIALGEVIMGRQPMNLAPIAGHRAFKDRWSGWPALWRPEAGKRARSHGPVVSRWNLPAPGHCASRASGNRVRVPYLILDKGAPMLTVISPAKKLDETARPLPDGISLTDPAFAAQAAALARLARGLDVTGLQRLMDISEPLARLNHARFAAFRAVPGAGQAFPAIRCFAGDTYTGLDAATFSADANRWAEGHLRILSGLYGLLRPFDAILPYRLEMGSRLANPKGADLYAFWGDRIAKALTAQAREMGTDTLVNCASVEYFAAADRKALKLRVISPVFLDAKGDQAKIISFWAKRARGAMARFILDNRLADPGDLRAFSTGGYRFQADLSTETRPVFLRAEAQAA
jgi:uncharacterized protein